MYLLQKAKAPMPFFRKAQGTRLFLVFASLLLCVTVLSVLGDTGTAYAASTASRSASIVKPATAGGGCASNAYLESCISENSEGLIVPDIYFLKSACSVSIGLYVTSATNPVTFDYLGTKCFAAGTHLYGFSNDAYLGYTWYTSAVSERPNVEVAISPYLYT